MPDKKREKTPDEIRQEVTQHALDTLNATLANESTSKITLTVEGCNDLARGKSAREYLAGFDDLLRQYLRAADELDRLAEVFSKWDEVHRGPAAVALLVALQDQANMLGDLQEKGRILRESALAHIPPAEELTERQWFIAFVDGLLPGLEPLARECGLSRSFTDTELGLIALAGGDLPKIEAGETVADVVNEMRRTMHKERERTRERLELGQKRQRAPAKRGRQQ